MAEIKKDIIWRVYIVYIGFLLFGIAIVGRIAQLQFGEGEKWKAKADSLTLSYRTIQPSRGNIYAADGSLLATSLPRYDVHLDMMAGGVTKDVFNASVDSLALCLSKLFNDKTKNEYKRMLREARNDKERYFLLRRNISFNEQRALRTFPVFRLGRNKGGLIIDQLSRRERPFKMLAARTVGYKMDNNDLKSVGIEGAFDESLRGVAGKRLMQRIASSVWKPVNNENEVEPRDGSDIITTIDLNLQDVAEHALEEQLKLHDADVGCAVLMEVSTGEIKAIANLKRTGDDIYSEDYNYAIAQSTEPGSTFKLASMMAALEDGYIDIDDTIDTYNGIARFSDVTLEDSHRIPQQKVSLRKAFASSLNVATSKLITKYYSKNPEAFIKRLEQMHLNEPLNIQLNGEGQPRIKSTKDKDWSKVSLPFISIGYESRLTPLQLLTFYNAVANNGKMVQPLFVKEIRNKGEVVKRFETKVLVDSICSSSTLAKARILLEEVVKTGTASHIRHAQYTIAGKTGTAQIAQGKDGYKTGKVKYQASFCGYFPADNPKFSCIVVVYAPGKDVYYGASIACPVFKEIADKVYALDTEMHEELNTVPDSLYSGLPKAKAGRTQPSVYAGAKLKINIPATETGWINAQQKSLTIKENIVPSVMGMGLRDAIYLLESQGLNVKPVGRGAVVKQSLPAGAKIEKGQLIVIELG
jgi:cell division protein FtsI (penicillin-binding protein 3)